jgi:protein-tyrosine phosphatase
MRLLFVCTGNLCRSAAADRLIASWAAHHGARVEVRSAGTRARDGRPLHPRTERALARHGVRADDFASSRLTEEAVDWADLVLTMTSEHREEVVAVAPRGMRKVFTLLEAAALYTALPPEGRRTDRLPGALAAVRAQFARASGPEFDVVDPIEGSSRLHAEVVDQIADALSVLAPSVVGTALLEPEPAAVEQTVRIRALPPVPRPA